MLGRGKWPDRIEVVAQYTNGKGVKSSALVPFVRVAGIVERWREEVLNYWRFPLTSALVQGKYDRVKVVKRRAYGHRNGEVLLLRFLSVIHTD